MFCLLSRLFFHTYDLNSCTWKGEAEEPEFKIFKEPRNRFQGINSTSLSSLADRYGSPFSPRFLAPTKCLKIPVLQHSSHLQRRSRTRRSRRWPKGAARNGSMPASTLQRKSHLCIPFLGIARPQSQVSVSDLYVPRISPHIFGFGKIDRPILGIYKLSQIYECRNWEK
jgi:hypothetical protein